MGRARIHHRRDDDGFSLIELMIVVLIIGILVAIAIPVFLGARTRAHDRAMQSDLRTGLAAGLAFYAETRDWDGFDAVQADDEEPALAWVDGGAPAAGEISISLHDDDDLILVGLSGSGTYFCLAQVAGSPATDRGAALAFDDVDGAGQCTGGW
jgi:type IV pilus assembly protein PilA